MRVLRSENMQGMCKFTVNVYTQNLFTLIKVKISSYLFRWLKQSAAAPTILNWNSLPDSLRLSIWSI